MKKFEIVKTTAEISQKERNEIKEGCTMWIRKKKEFLSENDFSNRDKINDLYVSIYFNWGDFGQCWFNGKWYGYDTICKIQRKNKDDNWQRYV